MALVAFLRGVNVGGRRTFRPSRVARELSAYDVVNVGAAGTFVVRKPVPQGQLLADLRRRMPFHAEIALCKGSDLLQLEIENPFGVAPSAPDLVRFVSVLSKPARSRISGPITLPGTGEWFVQILGSRDKFVFGVYRRHMKTISHLAKIDQLFGAPATTRNWNTMLSVVRILKAQKMQRKQGAAAG